MEEIDEIRCCYCGEVITRLEWVLQPDEEPVHAECARSLRKDDLQRITDEASAISRQLMPAALAMDMTMVSSMCSRLRELADTYQRLNAAPTPPHPTRRGLRGGGLGGWRD